MKDKLKFNKNGKFVIMQVSDAQDMHYVRKGMFKMLNEAYKRVNPDLVLLTGDNILGNHLCDGRFLDNKKNNKNKKLIKKRMEKALAYLLEPLEKREIPFAMIYGNHDDMNIVSKDEQADIYKKYNFCCGFNNEGNGLPCDTYNLPVYSSDGQKICYNIWMIDSAGSDENGEPTYKYVTKDTVDWYVKKSNELKANNGGKNINSLMFQHIPVPQVKALIKECDPSLKNAFKGPDNTAYCIDESKTKGYMFEYPDVCDKDFGQLEAIKKQGDVCALVFGHDHICSYSANIDGVNIIQTSGASFRSYGNMVSRGVRVFEIDEKDLSVFSTYNLTYFEMFGTKFPSVFRYIMNADEMEKKRALILSLVGVFIVAFIVYILCSFHFLT